MPKLPPVMSLSAIRAVPPRLTTMPPLVVFGLLAMSIVLLAIDRLVVSVAWMPSAFGPSRRA